MSASVAPLYGKHAGTPWTRVPVGYLFWMVNEHSKQWEEAAAELKRRGAFLPTIEISHHAIDRASQRILKLWPGLDGAANGEEPVGFYTWLHDVAAEAWEKGVPEEDPDVRVHNGVRFVFHAGQEYPVLKTVNPERVAAVDPHRNGTAKAQATPAMRLGESVTTDTKRGAIVLPRSGLAFDTETTGFLPAGRICEVAWTRFENAGESSMFGETFAFFVDPGHPIPDDARAIHGITDEMVDGATVAPLLALKRLLLQYTTLGWNALGFDLPMLSAHLCGLVESPECKAGEIWDIGAIYKAHRMRTECWVQGGANFDREPWRRRDEEGVLEFQKRILDTRAKVKWNLQQAAVEFKIDTSDLTAHRAAGDAVATVRIWSEMVRRKDEILAPLLGEVI